MEAQTISPSITGEYYLKGVRETACGFQLNSDSSFQFFFSYGALDRYGEGKWSLQNGVVVCNSRPKPAHDFRLVKSEASPDKRIRVQLHDANTVLLRYVHCKIRGDGKVQEGLMNADGFIEFTPQAVAIIELQFEFCPEKTSVFTIAAKDYHDFEFAIEPWLMEVFFQNFCLLLNATGLSGGHPLSHEPTSFLYEKNISNLKL